MHKFFNALFLAFDSCLNFLAFGLGFSLTLFEETFNTFFYHKTMRYRTNLSHYMVVDQELVKQLSISR
jgi:hypothetical protein